MITKKVRVLCLAVLSCLLTGCSKLTVDNSVVSELDLQRFLGEWYEVACFDHRFERGMEQTRAKYVLREKRVFCNEVFTIRY